jgi:hypothetical protein|nr:MAG TPA: hypothetical protein [Caudoviricetes sp.]
MRLPAYIGGALLKRLTFEPRSMFRHEVRFEALQDARDTPEPPDLRTEAEKERSQYDSLFGYGLTEQRLTWILERLMSFQAMYFSANSPKGTRPMERDEVPTPDKLVKKKRKLTPSDLLRQFYGGDEDDEPAA